MKIDVIVGNPPYQAEAQGENKNFNSPIYNYFIDMAYEISDITILIHPGRFLFNAGKTPKSWNKKMLNDDTVKVTFYEQESSKIFQNTDIKGGVAVTYRNRNVKANPIKTFTHFEELKKLMDLVLSYENFNSINTIMYGRNLFKFSEQGMEYYKNKGNKGKIRNFETNVFDRFPLMFSDKQDKDSIGIYGRQNNERVVKWIKREFVEENDVIDTFNVFIPKANGTGAIGEVLSTPLIGEPLIGYTQTFIAFGSFNNKEEADNLLKYIKTKFARALLGIMKVTQDNANSEVWKFVPLQNFTNNSDIDWSKSIPEIDQQLYKKYNLSDEEINFIEEKVKAME